MSDFFVRRAPAASPADAAAALVDHVRQLLAAENRADPAAAETLLAPAFAGITRASGREEDRAALLAAIASPTRPGLWRYLVESETRAWVDGGLGVVSSVVQTRSPVVCEPTGCFRNLHVFQRDAGGWRCVAWQVTRVE